MTRNQLCEITGCTDIHDVPKEIYRILFGEEKGDFFRALLELNNFDVSKDWFQEIYEGELSERKEKKQDFTPNTLGVICSELSGVKDGSTYEPTAGNGSMLIADWWRKASKHAPFDFYPSRNPIECWELSDRSIPILLLNLSIRGIVGVVHHGDVLEQTEKARYILSNPKDDCLGFSEITKVL